jgi:hypothetical protein
MPAWGWLKYAPWGEIAKAAAKVPGLVRELRGGDDDEAPTPPPRPPADGEPPDVAQLRFEVELLKSGIDKVRAQGDAQQRALEQHARALAQELATISARLRTVTWIASVALLAALAAVATALLR